MSLKDNPPKQNQNTKKKHKTKQYIENITSCAEVSVPKRVSHSTSYSLSGEDAPREW